MDKFLKILKWVLLGLSVMAIIFAISFITRSCSTPKPEVQAIARGDVKSNYEENYKKNTEIKFVDRIVYKEVPPKVVYVQKVDSVFIEKQKDKDLILQIEKDGTALKATTININGEKIKEYNFENVGNDFTLTSQDSSLFAKSNRYEWEGINLTAGYQVAKYDATIKEFSTNNLYLGLNTGVKIGTKLKLSLYTRYFPTQNQFPSCGLEASLRIK